MCHQKRPYFFSLALTERPPFLPTFTQWPPIFNKLLVTKGPWHIFVTKRPLIFAFNSQTSDNFRQKNWIFRKFYKFDAMLRNFCPFWLWKPLFFDAFHWNTPFFDAICHRKTPTSDFTKTTFFGHLITEISVSSGRHKVMLLWKSLKHTPLN